MIDAHQTVVLTALNNQQRVKTVQDVGQMPFTEFSALYAVSLDDTAIGSLAKHIHMTFFSFCQTSLAHLQMCVTKLPDASVVLHFVTSRLDEQTRTLLYMIMCMPNTISSAI